MSDAMWDDPHRRTHSSHPYRHLSGDPHPGGVAVCRVQASSRLISQRSANPRNGRNATQMTGVQSGAPRVRSHAYDLLLLLTNTWRPPSCTAQACCWLIDYASTASHRDHSIGYHRAGLASPNAHTYISSSSSGPVPMPTVADCCPRTASL